MEHAGRPIPHQRLLTSIWGSGYGNEREYLRVIINQLRKKNRRRPGAALLYLDGKLHRLSLSRGVRRLASRLEVTTQSDL
ncbi:winged helix-turn-helix domain-containing protein [Edaphobacter aggregans]|uniref:winged helix-turn-helix domain-containing protein n=1 Tax=Edaphobacter aggregans TaxID=570835 RepID=UPI001FE0CEC0|nr:winged helix-turn-helix domain-containing protein [Edaphobacter aggregans]